MWPKFLRLTVGVAGCIAYVFSTSCTKVPYPKAFPLHYGITQAEETSEVGGFAQPNSPPNVLGNNGLLTEDVVATLPIDFALAHHVGYLRCLLDFEGYILIPGSDGRFNFPFSNRFFARSNDFREFTNAWEGKEYLRYDPVGYPNLSCFMPSEDPVEFFGLGWLTDWTNLVSSWQENELEIESLKTAVSNTYTLNASNALLLSGVNAEIADLNSKIAETEGQLVQAKQHLVSIQRSFIVKEPEYPPFDPKIPYDKDIDPFYGVLKKFLLNVSSKPWLDLSQVSGPYVDHELAQVLDVVHETLSDPKKIEKLPAEIRQAIVETGFQLKVTSGSRTPWKQATEIPAAKAKNLPAADYSKSRHMFGQSVDIRQPYQEGTSEYNNVKKILGHFGLNILPKDRVHIYLPRVSYWQKVNMLAMIREYKQVASNLRSNQSATKENLIFLKASAEKQKEQLEKDLAERRAERDNRAGVFERVSAELRRVNSEIQRKEAELRQEADRRDHWEARDFPRGPREAGGVGNDTMGGPRGGGEVIIFHEPEVIIGHPR